jgi:hypothetical protein
VEQDDDGPRATIAIVDAKPFDLDELRRGTTPSGIDFLGRSIAPHS